MKKLLLQVITPLLILCGGGNAIAQTNIIPVSNRQESNFQIPPLEQLIDSAVAHNSMVKFRGHEIEAKESNLKSQRNYWTRNIGMQADSRYGTFDNFSTIGVGQTSGIVTTTTTQMNYGVGFYMKFPFVDIINRKNQVKQAKAELEQAKSMAEAQEDEVRQLVIRLYHDLLLKQRVLAIRSASVGNARVNMEMVEKEFRNGIINVAEYVRISDITARTESDYEEARATFVTAKMILEDVAGFTFRQQENYTRK